MLLIVLCHVCTLCSCACVVHRLEVVCVLIQAFSCATCGAIMTPEGKALSNIVVLGFGFMLMFTAFQTCGNIEVCVCGVCAQQTLLRSKD